LRAGIGPARGFAACGRAKPFRKPASLANLPPWRITAWIPAGKQQRDASVLKSHKKLECCVTIEDYKTVLYRQEDGSWVAEIPAIPGCYALMATREGALAELSNVFNMIAEEYSERGAVLPADTTEIVHA
jgi:predicted RNase H-like HicB family nuclease